MLTPVIPCPNKSEAARNGTPCESEAGIAGIVCELPLTVNATLMHRFQ